MSVQLKTDRLIIRQYTLDDLQDRYLLTRESFNPDETQAETEQWLQWTLANYEQLAALRQPPYSDYAVTLHSGTVVGSVGIVPSLVPWGVLPQFRAANEPEHFRVSPEVGLFYAMRTDQRGYGYATEAAQAIITYLFERLFVQRVIATTTHDNATSQQVMRKLGMTVYANPGDKPAWFQVVGVLNHPEINAAS